MQSINLGKNSKVHIVGIGGIGMSGIARILHKKGIFVQGSDEKRSKTTEELINLGVRVFHSHHASNISNVDIIIKSSAIKNNNPEIVHARKNSILVLERWEILRYVMEDKHNITITGAHGKTTTTGLLGHIFSVGNRRPNILVGGIINNFHSNYIHGKSDIFIVEADESDATFVKIPSESAIVTNIDTEHLDFYGSFENIQNHYKKFIQSTGSSGITAINADDTNLKSFDSTLDDKIVTYGIVNENADLHAFDLGLWEKGQTFSIKFSSRFCKKYGLTFDVLKDIKLSLLGTHNILNALSAVAVSLAYNIEASSITDALSSFDGMKRRFTKVAQIDGINIIDDYAHHPLEIVKTIESAWQAIRTKQNGKGNIIVILQPHKFSRLKVNFDAFASSVKESNYVFLVDVYSAGEDEIPNINSLTLANKISEYHKNCLYLDDKASLFTRIKKVAKCGDYVLFLGAGDITKTAYDFAQNYDNITI